MLPKIIHTNMWNNRDLYTSTLHIEWECRALYNKSSHTYTTTETDRHSDAGLHACSDMHMHADTHREMDACTHACTHA